MRRTPAKDVAGTSAGAGSKRLDIDHTGHRLDGAGDLRRELKQPGSVMSTTASRPEFGIDESCNSAIPQPKLPPK